MKRMILTASLTALAVCFFAVGTALASTPTRAHARQYLREYREARSQFGPSAVGCNLIGKRGACRKRSTDAEVVRSLGVLDRLLHPAQIPAPPTTTQAPSSYTPASNPTATYTQAPAYGGGYVIPGYIVKCESGGNWRAVNASSGAGGAYQILPSTWASYGGSGLPENASPAEQSRIAARIWADSGASAWSCG